MTEAQLKPVLHHFPSLPKTEGLAGMYAGVSKGILFCMGGANFTDKKPWEGGKKKWYDEIYMLAEGKEWIKLEQKMPAALAYGVSVTYKDQFITIGGNDDQHHTAEVKAYTWNGYSLSIIDYPELPVTLANMAGTVVGNLIILVGGNSTPVSPAMNKCFALDLDNLQGGWFEMDSIPGRERLLPTCASYNHQFYLFSGETVSVNEQNEKKRLILKDAYKMQPKKINGKWIANWETLSPMPRGGSAAGNPLPVLQNGTMVFWGGVDSITALHKDPATHPGISGEMFLYSPIDDTWKFVGVEEKVKARVTLPVVKWNNQWLYISGEIRPAVRTNAIDGINY